MFASRSFRAERQALMRVIKQEPQDDEASRNTQYPGCNVFHDSLLLFKLCFRRNAVLLRKVTIESNESSALRGLFEGFFLAPREPCLFLRGQFCRLWLRRLRFGRRRGADCGRYLSCGGANSLCRSHQNAIGRFVWCFFRWHIVSIPIRPGFVPCDVRLAIRVDFRRAARR